MAGIWGKIIGAAAGLALGGPIGALIGGVAGHAVDRMRASQEPGEGRDATREIAFTIAVIALCAKMAKADGRVTRDEIAAFRRIFHVPPEEMKNVGRVFDQARKDARGFEPYARQVASMFAANPAVLEELLDALFYIANADGVLHPAELDYLERVAAIFRFDETTFRRIRENHESGRKADPYAVLGVDRDADDETVRGAWLKLTRENHPDRLTAQGMPEDFVQIANERMAGINAAWDTIRKQRGIR
ncbi:MAG: TerB family tellurite resistance protein [Defluviicoccus sp.]|nr:TerB family tellurite resistance protein [Defluviicoccus sp.]